MQKWLKILIIYVCCAFPMALTHIMLLMSGAIYTSCNNFGVDSQGAVYVCTDSCGIIVYDDLREVRRIRKGTDRGYSFTLQEDDTILVSLGNVVLTMDLYGNVLSTDTYSTLWSPKLKNVRCSFVAANGDKYVRRNPWGRTVICRITGNGLETVYRLPLKCYFAKLFTVLYFVSLFAVVPWIIVESWKTSDRKPFWKM